MAGSAVAGSAGPTDGSVVSSEPSGFDEEEPEYEELPATQPPVHAFGSVWDSQLGVPTSASMPPSVDLAGADTATDEDFDEPEVPEYLLAERRQSGQRPGGVNRGRTGGGGRGRTGSYQAALDRERYGSSRPPQPSFGSGGGGGGNRTQGGNRDRNRQGRPPQNNRPMERGPRPQERPYSEQRSSSEPWSEVPPELEEMLRAELARKQPQQPMETMVVHSAVADVASAPAKPARKPRATAKKPTVAASARAEAAPPTGTESPAPAKRTTRARSTKSATTTASAAADAPAESASETEAKKPTRRRTTKSAPAAEEG